MGGGEGRGGGGVENEIGRSEVSPRSEATERSEAMQVNVQVNVQVVDHYHRYHRYVKINSSLIAHVTAFLSPPQPFLADCAHQYQAGEG